MRHRDHEDDGQEQAGPIARGEGAPARGALRHRTGEAAIRSYSALGEGVAGSANGEDEGGIDRVVLELLAQMADVDVDGLLVLVEGLVVAHQLEQLTPAEDAPGSRGQVTQDLELRGRQADAPVAPLDAPPVEVDDELPMADEPPTGGVGEVAIGATKEGLDAAAAARAGRYGLVM